MTEDSKLMFPSCTNAGTTAPGCIWRYAESNWSPRRMSTNRPSLSTPYSASVSRTLITQTEVECSYRVIVPRHLEIGLSTQPN